MEHIRYDETAHSNISGDKRYFVTKLELDPQYLVLPIALSKSTVRVGCAA